MENQIRERNYNLEAQEAQKTREDNTQNASGESMEILKKAFHATTDTIASAADTLSGIIDPARTENISGKASQKFEQLKENVKESKDEIKEQVKELPNKISEKASEKIDQAKGQEGQGQVLKERNYNLEAQEAQKAREANTEKERNYNLEAQSANTENASGESMELLKKVFHATTDTIASAADTLSGIIDPARTENIGGKASQKFEQLKENVKESKDEIKEQVKELPSKISEKASEKIDQVKGQEGQGQAPKERNYNLEAQEALKAREAKQEQAPKERNYNLEAQNAQNTQDDNTQNTSGGSMEILKNVFHATTDTIASAADTLSGIIDPARTENIGGKASQKFEQLKENVKESKDEIKEQVKELPNKISEKASEKMDELKGQGEESKPLGGQGQEEGGNLRQRVLEKMEEMGDNDEDGPGKEKAKTLDKINSEYRELTRKIAGQIDHLKQLSQIREGDQNPQGQSSEHHEQHHLSEHHLTTESPSFQPPEHGEHAEHHLSTESPSFQPTEQSHVLAEKLKEALEDKSHKLTEVLEEATEGERTGERSPKAEKGQSFTEKVKGAAEKIRPGDSSPKGEKSESFTEKVQQGAQDLSKKISGKAQEAKESVSSKADELKESPKESGERSPRAEKGQSFTEKVQQGAQDLSSQISGKAQEAKESISSKTDELKESSKNLARKISDNVEQYKDSGDLTSETTIQPNKEGPNVLEKANEQFSNVTEKISEKVDEVKEAILPGEEGQPLEERVPLLDKVIEGFHNVSTKINVITSIFKHKEENTKEENIKEEKGSKTQEREPAESPDKGPSLKEKMSSSLQETSGNISRNLQSASDKIKGNLQGASGKISCMASKLTGKGKEEEEEVIGVGGVMTCDLPTPPSTNEHPPGTEYGQPSNPIKYPPPTYGERFHNIAEQISEKVGGAKGQISGALHSASHQLSGGVHGLKNKLSFGKGEPHVINEWEQIERLDEQEKQENQENEQPQGEEVQEGSQKQGLGARIAQKVSGLRDKFRSGKKEEEFHVVESGFSESVSEFKQEKRAEELGQQELVSNNPYEALDEESASKRTIGGDITNKFEGEEESEGKGKPFGQKMKESISGTSSKISQTLTQTKGKIQSAFTSEDKENAQQIA